MSNFLIDGIVPIIPTPFDQNEAIAWEDLDSLIDFAVAAGACAVCLPAYASEFYKLSEEERLGIVQRAVQHARGRVAVIAQVNSASQRLAIEWAKRVTDAGASAVCSASPRLFPLPEADLFDYFDGLLATLRVPFVMQDFNPGGSSMSVATLARLHQKHPHFRYVKLEEPMLSSKVIAIREATGGGLGTLEGWGGMYTLELAHAGIAGVVPGLGLTDVLDRVFRASKAGKQDEVRPLFEAILPQIVYSLQNLELFHHAEKRLLRTRGVLQNITVRKATMTLGAQDLEYIESLNARVLALLREAGFAATGGPA